MSNAQDKVAQQIEAAFAHAEYPGDSNIAYDQSGGHLECNQVARRFRAKQWKNLKIEFLRRNADAVFFFTPMAYAYFLPAFLLASIRDPSHADVIPGNLVVSLSPSLSRAEPEQFLNRAENLTVPQRRAVAQFLNHLATEHAAAFPLGDPTIALDDFWSRYLDRVD
jgi:hypothetical protein